MKSVVVVDSDEDIEAIISNVLHDLCKVQLLLYLLFQGTLYNSRTPKVIWGHFVIVKLINSRTFFSCTAQNLSFKDRSYKKAFSTAFCPYKKKVIGLDISFCTSDHERFLEFKVKTCKRASKSANIERLNLSYSLKGFTRLRRHLKRVRGNYNLGNWHNHYRSIYNC